MLILHAGLIEHRLLLWGERRKQRRKGSGSFTPLWHGLPTVSPCPTEGLPGIPEETFGRAAWLGQETKSSLAGR